MSSSVSNALKSILHSRSLPNKGLKWVLGNGNQINFRYDYWMEESSLIQKILPNTEHIINYQAKVTNYINANNHWNLSHLNDFLPYPVIEKFFTSLFL